MIPNWTKGGDSAYTLGRIMNGRHHDFVYMILCTREMLISCCISTQHTLLSLQSRVLANKKDIEDGCGLNRKEGQPIWTLRLSPNATQIQTENQENLRPGWWRKNGTDLRNKGLIQGTKWQEEKPGIKWRLSRSELMQETKTNKETKKKQHGGQAGGARRQGTFSLGALGGQADASCM